MSEQEKKDYPSIGQQAKNLSQYTWDLLNYVGQNQPKALFVSDEVYAERINICKSCDRYDESENRCRECGCFLAAKAKIILQGCPLNKWSADQKGWDDKFGDLLQDIENSNK